MTSPFMRHIEACNDLPSPAGFIPFRIGTQQVGWLGPSLARALTFFPRDFHFDRDGVALAGRLRGPASRTEALAVVCRSLAGRGFFTLRDELFDIRAEPDGPVLGQIDRGAIPAFGVRAEGIHLNGLVRRADGLQVWVGVRSRRKPVAPGQLDHIVAGGMPAGLGPMECLVKEAAEEASIPPELAGRARKVAQLSYVMRFGEEGMRRDTVHAFDLDLPEDFTPIPADGEVERFELWPAQRLLEAVRDTEEVKFNVNLVLIDLFLREGLIDPASPEGRALRHGLEAGA
ncbi:DUF4743 domain-containing protein [Belnapia sp. T6]|uniref:DUF4743 domain-containing protein n=1 Tax=Belnapia mucosa TaxID=2804532 RepID=A0ABS1V3K2_9PROT|nr:DUF4743 domain-containing protein [Belnapia mucosa]MBL6456270.1 DUF4743 domain-containing protein [Belnapia mucosa]